MNDLFHLVARLLNRHDLCLIAGGIVLGAALTASISRRQASKSTFADWWNSEGMPLWIMALLIGGGLILLAP